MSKRTTTIWLVLMINFLLGMGPVFARNLGPVLPVASEAGNQQNPAVVAIPDKGYWLVVWEDWTNPLESDISGAFVRMKEVEDGDCSPPRISYQGKCYEGLEICAGPFGVEGGDGYNQYRPSVAYDHHHGKLLVVWQDDRWPYLKFRILDTPDACEEPTIHELQSVPFNPTRDCTTCQGTCVCAGQISYKDLCELGDNWNPCDNRCYEIGVRLTEEAECNNQYGTWCSRNNICYRSSECRHNPCNGNCYQNVQTYQSGGTWCDQNSTYYLNQTGNRNPCNNLCYEEVQTSLTQQECNNQGGAWCDQNSTCYLNQTGNRNPCDNLCYEEAYQCDGVWCGLNKTCYTDPSCQCNISYETLCEERDGGFYNGEYLSLEWTGEECQKKIKFSYNDKDKCQDKPYFEEDSISYPSYPECSEELCEERVCGPQFMETLLDESDLQTTPLEDLDTLLSRKYVRVIYNPHDRAFWFGWLEKRAGRNRVREEGCGLIRETVSGEGTLPAYGKLDVSATNIDWNNLENENLWEIGDLSTKGDYATMSRRLSSGDSEEAPSCEGETICSISYEHELFVNTGKLDLAPNTSEGGATLVWSGTKELVYLTFCHYKDGKSEFLTSSKFEPEEKLIWAIHSDNIHFSGWPSKQISEVGPAYHPAIEFDPVTNRYLVVWEDSRATEVNTPKIYGQLLDGLGLGLYHANFPLVLESQIGDFWSSLIQTNPDIAWDPVNQRFFVAWQDNRAGTVSIENIDIWGQHVDPEGSLRGENLLVSATEEGQPTAGNQLAPKIAYDPASGIYLAVWKDARHYAETGSDIYAQAFSVGQAQLTILDGAFNPLHPPVLDFGSLKVGQRKSLSFYLRNTGDVTLEICEMSLLEEPFFYLLIPQELFDGDQSTCLSLLPGMETRLTVEFAPAKEGSFSQNLKIASDAGERIIVLRGGVVPAVTVNQTEFNFGEVTKGSVKRLTLLLTNHLEQEVTVYVSSVDDPFEIEGLQNGDTIQAGQTLRAQIVFSPQEEGDFETEVYLSFSLGQDITLSLSGKGTSGPTFSPNSIDFGDVFTGEEKCEEISLNLPSGELEITNFDIPPSFYFKEGLGEKYTNSATITLCFAPSKPGPVSEEVILNYEWNETRRTAVIAVQGNGVESLEPLFKPKEIDFNRVYVTEKKCEEFQIAVPNRPIVVETIIIEEPFSTDFQESSLEPGSYFYQICFSPSLTQEALFKVYEGELQITWKFEGDDEERIATVSLRGEGEKLSKATVTPTSLTFFLNSGKTKCLPIIIQNKESVASIEVRIQVDNDDFWIDGPNTFALSPRIKKRVYVCSDAEQKTSGKLVVESLFGDSLLGKTEVSLKVVRSGKMCFFLPEETFIFERSRPVWVLSYAGWQISKPSWMSCEEISSQTKFCYPSSISSGIFGGSFTFVSEGDASSIEEKVHLYVDELLYKDEWLHTCGKIPRLKLEISNKLEHVSLPLYAPSGSRAGEDGKIILFVDVDYSCAPWQWPAKIYLLARHYSFLGEEVFYYDAGRRVFAPQRRVYSIRPPFSLEGFEVDLVRSLASRIPSFEAAKGLWIFELGLEVEGEEYIYQIPLVVDELPDDMCL